MFTEEYNKFSSYYSQLQPYCSSKLIAFIKTTVFFYTYIVVLVCNYQVPKSMLEKLCPSMNVIIKEEIDDLVMVKEEIEDKEFLSLQENNQDNWSDTENCQLGEKLLPFEFIQLEPVEEEYQYVKEEFEEVLDLHEQEFYSYVNNKSEDKSPDLENASLNGVLIPFEYKQVESSEQSGQNFLAEKNLETENYTTRSQVIIATKDEILQKNPRFYSLLRPGRLQISTKNSSFHQSPKDSAIFLQNLKEKAPRAISEFKISLWETAQILMRREQDRKRKALRRARETEEERNLRRQKERLARAARRARESLEKKLLRRERDRKAKALSRAMRIGEKLKRRLGKNRLKENETFIQ